MKSNMTSGPTRNPTGQNCLLEHPEKYSETKPTQQLFQFSFHTDELNPKNIYLPFFSLQSDPIGFH